MHRLLMTAALGAAMLTQAPARADEAARIFGERAAASGMSLSPDGTKVAYLTPAGDRDALVIADVASGDTNVALRSDGSEFNINWCTWARAERLICQLYGISLVSDLMMGFSRIVGVNADGSDAIQLSQQQRMGEIATRNSGGSVENLLPDDPDHILMNLYQSVEHNQASRFGNDDGGTFLGRVNIDSGRITKLEGPNEETAGYFTDAAGNIRGQATFNTTGRLRLIGEDLNWFYRTADSRDWRRAGTTDMTENSGFGLEGFDESGEWLYFYDNHDGRAALYRMKADGSESRELVFSHPEVDVGSLRRIGKYDRPVGVGYTTEYTYVEYFDPKIKALRTALGRALPGEISIAILDESWDGNRKLIHAGSDTEPGTYYVFDTATKQLITLTKSRPNTDALTLATVKPVSYPASDGTMIPGYLTLPPGVEHRGLPLVVMPHGGPSARDVWGFDWLPQYLAAKGYAVLQPNYRGSAGYGEDWFAENGFQSWRLAMSDINDGARWLVKEGIADSEQLAMVGWSYGGYAALQANIADPSLYEAAVAIAPVTHLPKMLEAGRRYSSSKLLSAFMGSGEHLRSGSPALNAGKVNVPVLMFHGTKDLHVDIDQARVMQDALKDAGKQSDLIVYDELDHSLVSSDARTDMLMRIGAFLDQHVKGS